MVENENVSQWKKYRRRWWLRKKRENRRKTGN